MRGLSTVLYGCAGSGKTTQVLTFPRDKTLVIQFVQDDVTLHGTNIHVHKMKHDLSGFPELYAKLRDEKSPFKHIILDDFCLFSNYIVEYLRQSRELGYPKKQEKDNAVHETVRTIKNFCDLTELGIDVVFTTWDMTFSSDDGLTSSPMQINWEVTNYLCGLCNNVWEILKDDDLMSEKRWIRTKGSKLLKGKTKLPEGKKSPVDVIVPNPNLYKMLTSLKEVIYGKA